MLILNNDDVRAVLTMEMAIDALKQSYREIVDGEGICRPRIDLRFPTTTLPESTSGAPWREGRPTPATSPPG